MVGIPGMLLPHSCVTILSIDLVSFLELLSRFQLPARDVVKSSLTSVAKQARREYGKYIGNAELAQPCEQYHLQ